MAPQDRQRLVRLCAEYQTPIIEDDVYGDLHFAAHRPPLLKSYDSTNNVFVVLVSVENLGPGLRVGWLVAGSWQQQLPQQEKVTRSMGSPILHEAVVGRFLAGGEFDRHLRRLRSQLERRIDGLLGAVRQHFPSETRFIRPQGGMTFGPNCPLIVMLCACHAAVDAGIGIAPGPVFSIHDRYRHHLRLNAACWTESLDSVIAALARLLTHCRSHKNNAYADPALGILLRVERGHCLWFDIFVVWAILFVCCSHRRILRSLRINYAVEECLAHLGSPCRGYVDSAVCRLWIFGEGHARRVTRLVADGGTLLPDAGLALADGRFRRPLAGELPDDLQGILDAAADELLLLTPGLSIAVGIPDLGTWTFHGGYANAADQNAVDAADLFQVGSLTKLVTAAVVLQLVDEGALKLDDTIDTWYPNLPNADSIQIEHLLRHSSGLVNFNALLADTDSYQSPEEIIHVVSDQPPLFEPCTQWSYSNTGYVLLGKIVEHLTGAPFHQVVNERISSKLGLSSTAMRFPNESSVTIVTGHHAGEPISVADNYATAYAAGDLASTAGDMIALLHGLLAGEVISPAIVQQMSSQLAPMDASGLLFYGMGLQYYRISLDLETCLATVAA